VPDFPEVGLANIIFMYITPFILSFSLFGYVYKKKSIDFIGSMPISRKSIFATNTVGGIILIILTQLITLICTLILGAVTESTIFVTLALDIFIYQTIAYIFVFTVANLAMSVSGNVVTQIVTTLLILFTISASVLYVEAWDSPTISLMDDDYRISSNYRIAHSNNYTAPSLIFNNGEYYYNQASLIKMIVLSISYIALGYFLFKNKKLESAGESFASKTTHLIVKGLTLIPFVMILIVAVDSDEWEGILFLMAIIIVYYLIYDLITNKKNKVKDNAVALIVSIAVLFT
jgi:ABC-2 type transport system permease protein